MTRPRKNDYARRQCLQYVCKSRQNDWKPILRNCQSMLRTRCSAPRRRYSFGATGSDVCHCSTIEFVIAGADVDLIVSLPTDQHVIATTTIDNVIAETAVDLIVSLSNKQRNLANTKVTPSRSPPTCQDSNLDRSVLNGARKQVKIRSRMRHSLLTRHGPIGN